MFRPRMIRVHVHLPEPALESLRRMSAASGLPVAELVRVAVSAFVGANEHREPPKPARSDKQIRHETREWGKKFRAAQEAGELGTYPVGGPGTRGAKTFDAASFRAQDAADAARGEKAPRRRRP